MLQLPQNGTYFKIVSRPSEPQTRTSEIRQIEKMAAGENDDENFPEDFNEQEIYEESENEKP